MDTSGDEQRARHLFESKKFDDAFVLYTSLHALSGHDKFLYNAASCQFQLGRFAEAGAVMEKFWSARVFSPESGFLLGFCYRELNQLTRAKQHFLTMSGETSGPTKARCRLMVAMMTDDMGYTDEAVRLYEELIRDDDVTGETRADLCRRLAALRENRKDYIGALDLYRESLKHDAMGERAQAARFRMAVCLIEMSTPAEAVDILKGVETAAAGTFLGESASKLRVAVESSVRNIERNIRAYGE